MIVGTAGHIDHGKTSLVKVLTGIDADRLAEEKIRGITIDLGYAYQPLPDGGVLGFVDVPGHEKFIHNMLAGATGIDYVLLAVAADDGPMPQTLEHLAILDLLGLTEGVVALTKIDRVDAARRAAAIDDVERLLAATSCCAGYTLVPVSTVTGEGVADLQAQLCAAAASLTPKRRIDGHFRLAIDRSFTLAGIGTIVTGTVFAGQVAVGDRLTISPLGIEVRVRSLHAQNRAAELGGPGQRCALNLVAAQLERRAITRGQWLLGTPLHAPSQRLDGRMKLLPGETRPIRHWTPVHVHLAASHVNGRLALLEGERLKPGASALVQLVLDEPIGALHGDRFIVRDQSAQRTLGGGIVLDAFPPLRGRRKPPRLALLRALDVASPTDALSRLLELQTNGVDVDWFRQLHNLSDAVLAQMMSALPLRAFKPAGGAKAGPALAFSTAHWLRCAGQIQAWLATYHVRDPDSPGARLDQLRAALSDKPAIAVVSAILDQLIESGAVARTGSRFHLAGHKVRLSAAEQALWEHAQPSLIAAGLTPPRVAELAQRLSAKEELLRQLFIKLARMGLLHPVRREVFFLPQTVTRLAAQTEQLAQRHPEGIVTVGPFRTQTGLNRNLGIPVLEYFDRVGFTWRCKDGRRLRRSSAAVFGDSEV